MFLFKVTPQFSLWNKMFAAWLLSLLEFPSKPSGIKLCQDVAKIVLDISALLIGSPGRKLPQLNGLCIRPQVNPK
jgi:hypothetical protein